MLTDQYNKLSARLYPQSEKSKGSSQAKKQ